MPLAEFLRLMAESHITLIHGKCGKRLKGQWHFEFGGLVWGFWLVYWGFFCLGFFEGGGGTEMTQRECVLDWVNFVSSHAAVMI